MDAIQQEKLERRLLKVLLFLSQGLFWFALGGVLSRHTRLVVAMVMYGAMFVVMVPALTLAVRSLLSSRRST